VVVDVNSAPEQVSAYVKEHAARGLDHVKELVGGEGEAVLSLIAGVSENEAAYSPAAGEFSISQVVQHLNGSIERGIERLKTLTSGRPFVYEGPRIGPGSIPPDAPKTFAAARDAFAKGVDAVMAVLDAADPKVGLDLTSEHATFGPFNWLEWAVYSHHVHPHDHVLQIVKIKEALERRRQRVQQVRAAIRDQTALPTAELKARLSRESDSILALSEGLSEEEASFSPAEGEWSVSLVMQHLVGGYQRNRERIALLSSGRPYAGPPPVPGTLPDKPLGSFAEVRRLFVEARDAILDLLEKAGPSANLELTTEHSAFGSMNWREWCVFTLDFHARDHRGQIEKIKTALEQGAGRA